MKRGTLIFRMQATFAIAHAGKIKMTRQQFADVAGCCPRYITWYVMKHPECAKWVCKRSHEKKNRVDAILADAIARGIRLEASDVARQAGCDQSYPYQRRKFRSALKPVYASFISLPDAQEGIATAEGMGGKC